MGMENGKLNSCRAYRDEFAQCTHTENTIADAPVMGTRKCELWVILKGTSFQVSLKAGNILLDEDKPPNGTEGWTAIFDMPAIDLFWHVIRIKSEYH